MLPPKTRESKMNGTEKSIAAFAVGLLIIGLILWGVS